MCTIVFTKQQKYNNQSVHKACLRVYMCLVHAILGGVKTTALCRSAAEFE